MSVAVRRLVALALLLAICPGAGELIENAGHALRFGHLAHGEFAEHPHDADDPEHGCTATWHFCSCHSSVSFVMPRAGSAPPVDSHIAAAASSLPWPDGEALSGIYHPPRA